MKRKPLSKSEIKELNTKLEKFNIEFGKKERIDLIDNKFYYKDNEIILFIENDILLPTLKFILKNNIEMPTAVVDMGAVKFIANGADVMRPGVQTIPENLNEGDFVVIKDCNNMKALVIGQALKSSEELESQEGGKAFKNIHYIGDDIWNMEI